jgi:hypothetical protein
MSLVSSVETDSLLGELGRLNVQLESLSDGTASQRSAWPVNAHGLRELSDRFSETVTAPLAIGRHMDLLAVYMEVQAMVEGWEASALYEQLPRGAREFVLGWRALARAAADSSAEEASSVVEPDPLRAILRYTKP